MKNILLILFSIYLLAFPSHAAEHLTILTENLPPLNFVENGILVGPSVEIVKDRVG